MRLTKITLVFLAALWLSSVGLAQDAPNSKDVAAPAVQPLGNLTKEAPEEKYTHLKDARAKVEKFKEEGNIGQAVKAQRELLRIAQDEFSANRLIQLEEMLVLTDLLKQKKEDEEAGEMLTQIDEMMNECNECPAPFLEGLRKRLDELRSGQEGLSAP